MNTNKEKIHVVWLKRDLRLHDNEAISNALASNNRVLFLYAFEDTLINDTHYDERHWNFVKQSLEEINEELKKHNSQVLVINSEVVPGFNQLQNYFQVSGVFSHQETGLLTTYNRDNDFNRYCRNNSINWIENSNNGVLRKLLNRDDWFENWNEYMQKKQYRFLPKENQLISKEEIAKISLAFDIPNLTTKTSLIFQKGGTKTGWIFANYFFTEKPDEYLNHIAKPLKTRTSASRISPYLAWGNLSIRELYQKTVQLKSEKKNNKYLDVFISRLRWQAHFIQKFETEHTMEEASIHKGFHKLKKSISEEYQIAWQTGKTGFPLVDACVRCLNETGYLNFRMRVMLVSFFTDILWQPWQDATSHLSKMLLDFEPGIHFPQLQLQKLVGETDHHDLRIYNPIKDNLDNESNLVFIKKWCPELAHLPDQFVHEPYLMGLIEMKFNNFELDKDYPKPIVDIKKNRKKAMDILWNLKKNHL